MGTSHNFRVLSRLPDRAKPPSQLRHTELTQCVSWKVRRQRPVGTEEAEETVKEYEGGRPVYRKQKTQRKVIDDNTLQIAQAFRKWLSEQD